MHLDVQDEGTDRSRSLRNSAERFDPVGVAGRYHSRLDQIIDMKHALVKLARAIDWGFLEQPFGASRPTSRAPPLPTRLVAEPAIKRANLSLRKLKTYLGPAGRT